MKEKIKIINNQTTQPKKKQKWTLVLGWIVLFVIIIGITTIGGEKKSSSENTQPQQEVSKIVKFVNSLDGLKLRTQPSLSAGVLEVLKDKTEVEVLEEQKDWSEVKAGEKQGWVASKYLITSYEKMMMGLHEMVEEDREELRDKVDFKITAEEIYSRYVKCKEEVQTDSEGRVTFSPDIIPQKYEGKIVEITGIVEKAEDIVEVHKNSIGRSAWVKLHGETLPPIIQEQVDEGRRYYICLADRESHGCVAWVYSSSPQLINNIDRNDRITVIGQCNINPTGLACDVPDLMDSEVVERY